MVLGKPEGASSPRDLNMAAPPLRKYQALTYPLPGCPLKPNDQEKPSGKPEARTSKRG